MYKQDMLAQWDSSVMPSCHCLPVGITHGQCFKETLLPVPRVKAVGSEA